jgi:hypothetical protein
MAETRQRLDGRYLPPAPTTLPLPSRSLECFNVALSPDTLPRRQWRERAYSILDWARDVSNSQSDSNPCDCFPVDNSPVPHFMANLRQLRRRQDGSSSSSFSHPSSPTKRSGEYRITVLTQANIFVESHHELPPEINVLWITVENQLLTTVHQRDAGSFLLWAVIYFWIDQVPLKPCGSPCIAIL